MFQKSLTLSLLANLSIGAALSGGVVKAEVQPQGQIEFTADNASEVFLNGTSLGSSSNWQEQPIKLPVKSQLKQGKNVIGVAAWDYESIAAMSGKFEMPDGTTFDTSTNHYSEWRAYNAAPDINTPCNENSCVGKDRAEGSWRTNQINPLTGVADVDVPSGWNLAAFDAGAWLAPGWSFGEEPWNKFYNPGGGWIWYGVRGTGTDASNEWVTNNFTLFRYEFICAGEYCDTEENWEKKQIINVDSRSWDDIKQIVEAGRFAGAETYPLFAGGTLSFTGSGDLPNYTPNFFLTDKAFLEEVDLPELWNQDKNIDDKNVIDVAGNKVTFTGDLAGPGGMTFRSTGQAEASRGASILAGENTYSGETVVESGTLALASLTGLNSRSKTTVAGTGRLDLYNYPVLGTFKIDDLTIKQGGVALISHQQPLVSRTIKLEANGPDSENPGGIVTWLEGKDKPPITVGSVKKGEGFIYTSGTLFVNIPSENQEVNLDGNGEDRWKIIKGDVVNAEGLARNTFIQVDGQKGGGAYSFFGLGQENAALGLGALYNGYLEEGSFNLVITENDDLPCQLNPEDCEQPEEPPVITPPPICEGGDCDSVDKNEKPPTLPGCEDGDPLCDVISDRPGDSDNASKDDEEAAKEIIKGIQERDPSLPLLDYGQLAKLVGSGLAPRNIDAAGRGLQAYNNLLVDTLFERLPLRQFSPVELEEAVVEDEQQVTEQEPVEQVPVRGLWNKNVAVSDVDAQQALDQAIAQADASNAGSSELVESELMLLDFDGIRYMENPSLTAQYSKRDGWRAWFRGFGGDSKAYSSTTLYNDYSLNTGGGVVGADVSLSDSVQVGVYANYGNLNVNQLGDTGGGSWSPDGWGGGLSVDYWTENFFVQGVLGASGFSGTQKRGVLSITESWGGDSASAEKSATSILGALRVGSPFQSGGLYLEPQLTATWTHNNESSFSESGVNRALQLSYGSRTTNYLQTTLGLKLAYPINSGERAQWVPMLRFGWLGDWDTGNADQSIGYSFTDRKVDFNSNQSNENGALFEAGLDYTIANLNATSLKVYAKGGAEIWGGDRGTNWRASGGVTFQF